MLLSANEVSAELLTGRGGGDDAAPSNQRLSLPPQGSWGGAGGVIMMLMLLIPSQSCFLVCVLCGKSGRVLPPPHNTHTFFF